MKVSPAFASVLLPAFATCIFAQRMQFSDPVTAPISHSFSGPYSVAVSDLNQDGLREIVIGQLRAADLVIVPGGASERFRPPIRIPLGGNAGSVAIADFNGDEVPDIAAGCVRSSSTFYLVVLQGRGDLSFTESARIALASVPNDLAAADWNGDGRVDLAIAQTRSVLLLFGNGDGTFQPPVQLALPATPSLLRTADFDNNGAPDLAVAFDRSSMVAIMLAGGAEKFQQPISVDVGNRGWITGLTVADFDGDQHLDLAVCTNEDVVVMISGDGKASFRIANTLLQDRKYSMTAIDSADVDGDGLPDLVVGHYYSGVIRIFLNRGGGSMPVDIMGIKGDMFKLVLADLNGDSIIDLVVPSYSGNNVVVASGKGNGTFSPVRFLGSELDLAFTGDLDGDGRADLAVLDKLAGCLHILRRGSDPVADLCVELSPYTAAMADFNADGIPDFAISEGPVSWPTIDAPAFVRIFLGNGDLTFRELVRFEYEPWGGEIVVGDFNGDGIPDLAAPGLGNIALHPGKGDGTFSAPRSAFSSGAAPLAAADFDGDGKLDLVVREGVGTSSLSILLNAGDGTFRRGQKLKEDSFGPHSAALADLNGDGFPDLIASTPKSLYVFVGSRAGTFTSKATLARPGADPSSFSYPGIADVDGDGVPDIVAPNQSGNSAQLFLGNGDGTFGAPMTVPAGRQPISLGVSDFDGDGRNELVFASSLDGTVTMLKAGGTN